MAGERVVLMRRTWSLWLMLLALPVGLIFVLKRAPSLVKQHAARGHGIAGRVEALRPIREVIRHHHERLDGGGYPNGLRGEEIPLHSRTIAVAGTYDALTSTRLYRASRSAGDALAELRAASGSQFDARCVEAFIARRSRQPATGERSERAA